MSSIKCDRCQKESPQEQMNPDLIADGMVLMLDGYYGAFCDTIDDIPSANICHDCVGEIWRSIPKFAEYGKSLHSNSTYYCGQNTACCEFSS